MSAFDLFAPLRPWMRTLDRSTVRDDAIAGLTNAAIVLPQGVAFAIIAGLPPVYGLFTAMITPVIAAIWGSSLVMISGPTTAISAVLFATLSQLAAPETPLYINLALTLTITAGLFQIAAGVLRLGGMISFISHSVMVGFTAAAALSIAASQLGGALGIDVERGGGVLERLRHVAEGIAAFNPIAAIIAGLTIATLILCQWLSRKLPAYLLALVAGSAAARLLGAPEAGVAMFSALPTVVPSFTLPSVTPSQIVQILPGAATIAFVGLLEAISIGRTFAIRRHERFDSNQEFVGQGMSNAVGGLLQCYAGSGSFTRSALNAETGARTPLSAIFAAAFLFVLLLLVAPFVEHVPVPAMAGIILFVAYRLVNAAEVRHILSSSRRETLILIATFSAAILTELDTGIVVGVVVSLFVFLLRTARPHIAAVAPALTNGHRHLRGVLFYKLDQCPRISILRIEGQLFFGSAEYVESQFRRFERLFPGRNIKILAMKGLGQIDLAGADLLVEEIRKARAAGGDFHIVSAHIEMVNDLHRLHVIDVLGPSNLHPTKSQAIRAAVAQVKDDTCAGCRIRNFRECDARPHPADTAPALPPAEIQDVYQGLVQPDRAHPWRRG